MSARLSMTARELAAVLAGLRALQEAMDAHQGALPVRLLAIAANGGRFPALTATEIDRLAERLNLA